jgi:hypothetical protein
VNKGAKKIKKIGEKMVLRCFRGNAGRHWVYFTPVLSGAGQISSRGRDVALRRPDGAARRPCQGN